MHRCPGCQHDNADGARFCGGCRLEQRCAACGAANAAANRLCDRCGAALDPSARAAERPPADRLLASKAVLEGKRSR